MIGKKGQMFLIMGILIILFLITIRLAVQPPARLARIDDFDSSNIKNEFGNVQDFSAVNSTNITNNLNNFSLFLRTKLSERNLEVSSFYASVFVTNASNNTQANFTISVGNYLRAPITDVNITARNSTRIYNSTLVSRINDTNSATVNINFTMLGINQTIEVVYTLNNKTINQSFFFATEPAKYTISTLFDLKFKLSDKDVSERFFDTSVR